MTNVIKFLQTAFIIVKMTLAGPGMMIRNLIFLIIRGDLSAMDDEGGKRPAQSGTKQILPYSALFFLSSTNP